jgi:hypothetical protein
MMRLGRLQHDPARVAAVPRHVMGSSLVPETVLPPPGFKPLLVKNDVLTTCTIAGLVNCARVWTLKRFRYDPVVDEDLLLEFFCQVAGVPVTDIAGVDGLVMLDVLEAAQRIGFRINSQNVLVPEFRAIEVTDLGAVKDSIAETGSCYAGFDLRQADLSIDGTWDADTSSPIDGGHCAPPVGCSPQGFTEATWGIEKPATDAWMLSRLEEAYSVSWTMAGA